MEWTAPGILLICFACVCLSGCSNPLREPTVTVTSIALEGISLTTISIGTEIRVENPNPVGITLANLTFDLFYETEEGLRYLGHGGGENLTIPKNSTSTFHIPVEIENVQALQALGVMVKKGSLSLVARGTAAVDLKITTVRIPFEKRKVVP